MIDLAAAKKAYQEWTTKRLGKPLPKTSPTQIPIFPTEIQKAEESYRGWHEKNRISNA